MRIDRRGDDGTVTEKCLDEAKIHPLLKEHRGHGMAEYVGGDLLEPRRLGVTFQRHPDRLLRKPTSKTICEEKGVGLPADALDVDVRCEGGMHFTVTYRNQPLLITLTSDKDSPSVEVNSRDYKVRDF